MAGQCCHFGHARVVPYQNLVLTIAVRRHELIASLGEHEVADLRAGVNAVDRLIGVCVPKSDASVRSSTASRQQAGLVGVPSDGLHSRLVLPKLGQMLIALQVPYHQFIIITSAC